MDIAVIKHTRLRGRTVFRSHKVRNEWKLKELSNESKLYLKKNQNK